MILKKITDRNIFDGFVCGHPWSHYMKTTMWGDFQRRTNQYEYEMLGFYEGDELKGTALALHGRFFTHPFIYIPKGPCIDYNDENAVKEAADLLAQHAKEANVHFLRIDPNVLRMEKDIRGNIIEGGENHENVTEILKKAGYVHKGYNYAYDGSWSNRYTLTVDLSGDFSEVTARFSKPRRTSINRHKVNCVETHLGSEADIPELMKLEEQLAARDGFKPHSREFFADILDCFGDNARMYVTTVDLEGMAEGIEKELSGKKYAKDPEARQAKEKALAHTRELLKVYGKTVVIACGIFVRAGHVSYDLYAYNHKAFNHLNPVDSMHFFAMQDMKAHGVTTYDLCGFSGVTTKDDPEYGLYEYKRSFGSQYIEHIGEFDYPVKENAWKRFRLEKRAEVKLRRAYWKKKYAKEVSVEEAGK